MDRRKFIGNLAVGGLGLLAVPGLLRADDDSGLGEGSQLFPVPTNTGISGNVLIVGGGMAGAALAKYLRLWGGTGVNVTLIEKAGSYTSNIMSNKVLTGQLTMNNLSYAYSTLVNHYGVSLIQDTVTAIDANGKKVSRQNGADIAFDRLVLVPGLEFDPMPGMSSLEEYDTLVPHAWQAGPQTELLRKQLLALKAGTRVGDVVITIPKAPFRCPPGPYERACVIADWLKTNNVSSKVIVLDANAEVLVEKTNFMNAFNGAYGYIV
ncbi:MAG: FAD-dependent oxidoreductase, partial [Methylococcus sp.]